MTSGTRGFAGRTSFGRRPGRRWKRSSKYPVVKKANAPNDLMTVSEFLREVRRMVVDFVVGSVLKRADGDEGATGLDDVTTYYLLHRKRLRHG